MAESRGPGAAYWIDHFVVPTNDAVRWRAFMEHALGGQDGGGDPSRLSFMRVGLHHLGGSLQAERLPEQPALGTGLPRYGFYVRQHDIDAHLKRFEECGVQFGDPVRTSASGENGVAVAFRDPDGNELELWGPDDLPIGAMDSGNPLEVGRISHAILESRDLDRSLAFHSAYLGGEPIGGADIGRDIAVLALAAGGRIIFEKVGPEVVTRGGEVYSGGHTAFAVRDEEWDLVHERLWAGLPEAPESESRDAADSGGRQLHEPRTRQRTNMRNRGIMAPRGYSFCDWDNSSFHFVRGAFAPGSNVYHDTVPTLAD